LLYNVTLCSVQHTTAENFLFFSLLALVPHQTTRQERPPALPPPSTSLVVLRLHPRTEENFASSEDVRKKRARETIAQKINKGFF
jgi:hypothetical protein